MEHGYLPETWTDLLVAMDWLDERQSGLGGQLEREFFAVVEVVRERPFAFASDQAGYRPCRLERINAVLYFLIIADCVVIVGLLVAGQDTTRLAGRS